VKTAKLRHLARALAAAFAVAAAFPLFSSGLAAQTGLTGDPLVDSILQAPGPDFIERRRPPREDARVWDGEQPRERPRDQAAPGEAWDRPADDWADRGPEPAPTRRARQTPPPPPAPRGEGPLDIVILDSDPAGSEPAETSAPQFPTVSGDAAEPARQNETAAAADAEEPYRETAEPAEVETPVDEPDRVAAVTPPATGRAPATPAQAPQRSEADPQLDRMIGQMIMAGFPGQAPSEASVERIAAQIEDGRVGGVILMSRNVDSPRQVRQLTRYLARAGEGQPTPFIAVDQEGGYVQRLSRVKGFKTHPSAERLGARNDPQGAYSAYRNLALELRDYGFNVNLGPVVDLNLNPANPVIGRLRRSYGKDPDHVTAFAKAFVYAHNESGVLTSAKHFPGHGSSDTDSHDVLVDISGTWQESELRPYRKLIEAGAIDMIMTGHLYHPAFSDSPDTPVSLSPKAIERVLRESLNYDGVVITDDLDMRGVRQNTTFAERIVRAVSAGNDILLITNGNGYEPDLPQRVADAIRAAIDEGRLSVARIRASYERIMDLKDELARLQRTATSAGEDRGLAEHTSDG